MKTAPADHWIYKRGLTYLMLSSDPSSRNILDEQPTNLAESQPASAELQEQVRDESESGDEQKQNQEGDGYDKG